MSVNTKEPVEMIRQRAKQQQVLFNLDDILALLDRIAALEAARRVLNGAWPAAALASEAAVHEYVHGVQRSIGQECGVPVGLLLGEPIIIPARWACDTCGARQIYQGEAEPPLHECRPSDSGGE